MNTKIRENAYKLMELVYATVDQSFMIRNLDCTPLIEAGISAEDLAVASRYLSSKGYVATQDVAGEKWSSAKVMASGIDWVEDERLAEAAKASNGKKK